MKSKKTTVNFTPNNWGKIQAIVQDTQRSQSDIINQAISGIPIIMLGNQKSLAESFFELRRLIIQNEINELSEEVDRICLSLNLLTEKLLELMQSETE